MDEQQASVTRPPPSALPRPSKSKLPVLKPRSVPAPTAISTASIPQRQPSPLLSESQPTPKPAPASNTASRLTKRASIASLSGAAKSSGAPTVSKPLASRTSLPNGSKPSAKPSAGPTTISSRTNLQKRQTSASLAKPPVSKDDEENHDQLSSLDSFRSHSRQGFRSASLDEAPFDDDAPPLPQNGELRGRKGSRPSLSDRTIESLQSVPTTPKDRRRSSFFNPPESPMGPLPRPTSSLSRHGRSRSRPGTSDGTFAKPLSRPSSPGKKAPATAQPSTRTISRVPSISSIPSTRRSVSGNFTSKLQSVRTAATQKSPVKQSSINGLNKSFTESRSLSASRPPKPKPALGAAFAPAKRKSSSNLKSDEVSEEPKRAVSNSSAALRQQIAAAKAAARKQKQVMHDSPVEPAIVLENGSFDLEMHADPFNQGPKDDKHILRNRINNARRDGKLNIAAMGLKDIPEEVRNMYDAATLEESKVNWAELVDLTKFIAADNEFEELDPLLFPDSSFEDLAANEDVQEAQFGGLELVDLHGNSLQSLPLGFRRLERLTTLNLSNNKLDMSAFDVITQIKSLKDLRLGNNGLTGTLPTALCDLPYLEALDLQANRLLSLPEALRELTSLKVLNVAGNQLTALPMEALQQLPLVELDASGNALIASLFPLGVPSAHSTLQVLNVANNSLAGLTFMESLDLPQLRSLDVTNNHLTVLPSVAGWTELITLAVGDNKVSEFPGGFTKLQKLRNVNFTSNEIRLLDPEISKMESLDFLILASNPLREKKFLTMSAADIKRDLRSRLEPEPAESFDDEEPSSPVTVIGDSERPSTMWSTKGNGILDLSGKDLSDDLNDALGSFLNSNEIKQIQLQSNNITCIPPALWMAQDLRVLDLSSNALSLDYLSDELELPSLQELNLSRCRLTSLEPLLANLRAPKLHTLHVSANRLSGDLPALRETYPTLSIFFASDNKFSSLNADALRGMHTVNLASNEIAQLPAEVGLLWDEGLKSLEIGSNAFRVPNYRILDKGTEATLRWLRDRLPAHSVGDTAEFE